MPDGEDIHSVDRIAEGFQKGAYSIFEDSREKDIVLWQPGTVVEDIRSMPRPRETRRSSATSKTGGRSRR